MKTLKSLMQPISHLLTFLILLQGCTVYKKQNISLEQAAATNNKVELLTKQNQTQKFLYITSINDEFYGVNKVNSQLFKTPLHEEDIEIIRTKDKGTSTFLTILAIGAGGFAALYILALIAWNNTFDSW